MIRVGLTGGIASGKTTVADLFAELGAVLIDTDIVARDLVHPGSPALAKIADTFGHGVLAPDGTLDRRALRELVFDDGSKRRALEAILHPEIRAETERRMRTLGGPYQIVIVPLLVGSSLLAAVDRVLVVDCSEQTQLRRLLRRDGISEDLARKMLASQASRDERLAIADDVVNNDGELSDTRGQVEQLHRHYLELAGAAG